MSEIIVDLEEEYHQSLKTLLDREMDREYSKHLKSKGKRLSSSGKFKMSVSGEEIFGSCDDGKKSHDFRFTIPLYDLEEGYSFAVCSCSDSSRVLESERCAHLFAAQQKLWQHLDEMQASTDGLDEGWQRAFRALDSAEKSKQEVRGGKPGYRILWEVGDDLVPRPRLQNKKPDGWSHGRVLSGEEFARGGDCWPDQQAQLCAAHFQFDKDSRHLHLNIFGLWQELRGCSLVVNQSSGEFLSVVSGQLGLVFSSLKDGYLVQVSIAEDPGYRRVIYDGGKMAFLSQDRKRILLCEPEERYHGIVEKFYRGNEIIPASDRHELLSYLGQLEGEIRLDYETLAPKPLNEGDSRLILRFEPLFPSGLTAEVVLRPAQFGRVFSPGMGPEKVLDLRDPEFPKRVQRDLQCESEDCRDLISRLDLNRFQKHPDKPLFFLPDEEALEFVFDLDKALKGDLNDKIVVEWPENNSKPSISKEEVGEVVPQITMNRGQDWFDLKIKIEDDEADLAQILKMLQDKRRFICLKGGLYAKVSLAFKQRMERLVSRLALDREGQLTPLAMLPEAFEAEKDGEVDICMNGQAKRMIESMTKSECLDLAMPEGIRAELRSYQHEGVLFLLRVSQWSAGACLADDMGLGKTLQSIVFLRARASEGASLVICPTSVVSNWLSEIERFAPDLRALSYQDWSLGKRPLGPFGVLVCSFGMALSQVEVLQQLHWNVLVVDEAQMVKNHRSKTWKALQSLPRKFCLGLSGTPVENNLSELWSIIELAVPGILGSFRQFRDEFILPIEQNGVTDAKSLLGKIIGPLILRRLKEDCLKELPSKTEKTLWVDLSPEERIVYECLRKEALEKLSNEESEKDDAETSQEKRFEVLAALARLRMCSCHVKLVDPDWEGPSSKLLELMRLLHDLREGGHRVLIFSQFVGHLEIVKAACDSRGYMTECLTGSTSHSKRKDLVAAFQGGSFDIFLISLKAGGTGLTLTRADYVIHIDPWWNPAVEDQATDRAYRMGQTRPVTIYRLMTRGTVEEKILALHKGKRKLADDILSHAQIDPSVDLGTLL